LSGCRFNSSGYSGRDVGILDTIPSNGNAVALGQAKPSLSAEGLSSKALRCPEIRGIPVA
jgi:hypothetical protein